MEAIPLAELLAAERITSLDAEALGRYNEAELARALRSRANDKKDYLLQRQLGPSAYEGDIERARIVLLLSNPGFDSTSTPDDHQFRREGWPLAGLHPEAPKGLREWWEGNLAHLISHFGARRVSQRVACLQLTPWASNSFDSDLRLPSRRDLLDSAGQCARRGAVMLVMRSERLWLESPELARSLNRYCSRNVRRAFITEGNLGREAWGRVWEAFSDD